MIKDSIRQFFTYFAHNVIIGYLIGYAFVLLIGFLDYLTGYRLGFSIFYLIPIAMIVWHYGLKPGIVISLVSTGVWLLADGAARDFEFSLFILVWNACIRMGFFLTVTVVLAHLRKSLEREKVLARTDYLTGIANNQAFMEILDEEIRRSKRYRHPLTVAYMDCDGFKSVNDTLGHETGNQLLRAVAVTVRKVIRNIDKVGRLGGDEFMVLFPESGAGNAKIVVDRLREGLSAEMERNRWKVTFSIGVATFDGIDAAPSSVISTADHLMYDAKKKGKNRIVSKTFSNKG